MYMNVKCPICGTEQELKMNVVVDVETVKHGDETETRVKSVEVGEVETPELTVDAIEIYHHRKEISHKNRNAIKKDLIKVMAKYGIEADVGFIW